MSIRSSEGCGNGLAFGISSLAYFCGGELKPSADKSKLLGLLYFFWEFFRSTDDGTLIFSRGET